MPMKRWLAHALGALALATSLAAVACPLCLAGGR
jgi:hypothetical protein